MTQSRALAVLFLLGAFAPPSAISQGWVTAYYTGWRQSRLAADQIDYDAVTHVVHFAIVPRPDGTLDASGNLMTPANVASAVRAAHEANKKILFTVGGQNSRIGFEGAMSRKNRDVFIAGLVRFLHENKYDGIRERARLYGVY
jgi:chitinase